jgi:hypothetical protein
LLLLSLSPAIACGAVATLAMTRSNPQAAILETLHRRRMVMKLLSKKRDTYPSTAEVPYLCHVLVARVNWVAQFLGVCSRSKWSKHRTKSPCLALLAMAGSNAAYKIISAYSNAVS